MLNCRVINNVLCPFHGSEYSDSNDSGPFMGAALLSSHNDALINNVRFIMDIFSLLFSMFAMFFHVLF